MNADTPDKSVTIVLFGFLQYWHISLCLLVVRVDYCHRETAGCADTVDYFICERAILEHSIMFATVIALNNLHRVEVIVIHYWHCKLQ